MVTKLITTKVSAADRVLDTFRDLDDVVTAKHIMDVTGLSRTTVNDNLRKLALAGKVVRFDKDNTVEWRLTPAQKKANKAAAAKVARLAKSASEGKVAVLNTAEGTVTMTTPKPRAAAAAKPRTDVRENTTPQRTASGRRRKGEIDGEIVAFFMSNDNTPTGSYKVAQHIGSSAGAAYVALNRMEREGTVVKTQSDPDRYALPTN